MKTERDQMLELASIQRELERIKTNLNIIATRLKNNRMHGAIQGNVTESLYFLTEAISRAHHVIQAHANLPAPDEPAPPT